MDHFRNSYNQVNQGQPSGWYGNTANQYSGGQPMARSNSLPQSGWNGWSYTGSNNQQRPQQLQQAVQQQQPGNNVQYVQLNWNNLLGGAGGQTPVTSTGTSAFQLPKPTNSGYLHQGYGVRNGQGQAQQAQQQSPAKFTVSLGNQGDQGSYFGNNNNGGSGGSSSYEIVSPQMNFPNSSGDQFVVNEASNNIVGEAQNQSQDAGGKAVVESSKVKKEKYLPCGTCKACQYQKTRKPSATYSNYLIRNTDDKGRVIKK